MEMLKISLPYDFVTSRTRLTWQEAEYGISNELFSPASAIEMAVQQLEKDEHSPAALLDLAALDADDSVIDHVSRLASREAEESIDEIRMKWLYLLLAWIFEHRDRYTDPLGLVEMIYADFDYPEEIAELVRYMPSDEPSPGSKELCEQRLYDEWREYLRRKAEAFRQ